MTMSTFINKSILYAMKLVPLTVALLGASNAITLNSGAMTMAELNSKHSKAGQPDDDSHLA